ncbi:hypothetical protein SAMN05421788_11243 [Filimonas lacunae]|uniref:Calcineurin-like phosphoesterase domain-containing protein n=1 Tax=Filimonas lacunae TaxID=477680 RepID=A0A173ML80_9BACT|nr:metallophosphoesterase [Filimonas lacunae]BAV08240.1 phosphoesterase [Filimonas lacunae]SIT33145.1 hypothetical protein SAMN05421788_11243 [Filimonas lacunae]
MRNWGSWWGVALCMLALDWYVFMALRAVTRRFPVVVKRVLYIIYWVLAVGCVVSIAYFPYMQGVAAAKFFRNYLFAICIGMFFAKLLAAIFFALDDIRRLFQWLARRFFPPKKVLDDDNPEAIPRSAFLSWLGMGIGGSLLLSLIYGFSNKYRYKVHRVKLSYPNLPPAFKGLRIVQISDIHSGSFQNKPAVNRGVDMILAEKADLILFTGDLVNDRSEEMENYMDVFNRLKAPMGVYSTLGNHDYGDYLVWPSDEAKVANLERLKQIHGELGWRLLMNEHVVLEREGQKIAVLGIENWGAKGKFPKYGKMDQAYAGAEQYPFKILLSHDPSHWDAEVRPHYPSIDLALAGHTHGMQFGVELPHLKWSPIKYMYKEWAGLYEEGAQKLYVNRGYGFLGYPGRVGILPEITVIELV